MNKFVVQPLEKKMNRQNPITRLEKAERAAGVKPSESVGALAELSGATGDLDIVGTLRIVDPETGEVQIREDNEGIAIETPSTETTFNAYRFDDGENTLSYVAGYTGSGLGSYLAIKALGDTPASSPGNANINIRAFSSSDPTAVATVLIEAIHSGTPGPAIGLYGPLDRILLNANLSDVDIQIKSSTDTYFSYWDSGLHAIGLGQNASSDYFLSIGGDVNLASGHKYYINGVEIGSGSGGGGDGWTTYSTVVPTLTASDDPTYTLQFAGVNLTTALEEGMPVKLTQNSITRYGYFSSAPSYSGGNTTITVLTRVDGSSTDYDILNTTTYPITGFAYGMKKTCPFGFPSVREYWDVKVSDLTLQSQNTPTADVWYNITGLQITKPIGSFLPYYCAVAEAFDNDGLVSNAIYSTLSTGSSSETENAITRMAVIQAAATSANVLAVWSSVSGTGATSANAKQTYYLNCKTSATGVDTLYFRGDRVETVLKMICTYL